MAAIASRSRPSVALRALGYDVVATPRRGARHRASPRTLRRAAKLDAGDVIVAVDGVPVRTTDELRSEIGSGSPATTVRLTVRRGGEKVDVTVRTIPSPADRTRPIVGILVDQDAQIDLPFDVTSTSGASAGRRPGFPSRSRSPASSDATSPTAAGSPPPASSRSTATVLPIGGIKQKTIGARRADVDFFLVPAGRTRGSASEMRTACASSLWRVFNRRCDLLATADVKC